MPQLAKIIVKICHPGINNADKTAMLFYTANPIAGLDSLSGFCRGSESGYDSESIECGQAGINYV
ncbi:MAG: hypothetical protein CL558_12340 [Alphaproteobacteria bacterium]|nr:hypothetical protein [Alphaproteobacteria bacterium]MAS46303.1 hypothetical protein [Alphaproteobacteria bacterium]MAX95511.1 hypothetical protein [Alphaproteobacteria bacterium]MBN54350.1 hypothetical protein [Alphaproteobacteria bacterium]OUT42086.1 MAG: hypothetical protein CBB62_07240 [Micavibrio sp. TMED2]|tara:strand:+ start:144 stop:338 length:195 start_codon:yes stop_codon:yes gene_type:complete